MPTLLYTYIFNIYHLVFVGFYGISTIVDYLMPNTLYTYISNTYHLVWFGFMTWTIEGYQKLNHLHTYISNVYDLICDLWTNFVNNILKRTQAHFCRHLNGFKYCYLGCCPEDLPRAMNDREEWRERVRDIRAASTIWWWWWICTQLNVMWTWEQGQWRCTPLSSKPQYYWSFTTRLFCVLCRTLVRGSYTSAETQSVYSIDPADWA